MVLLAPNPISVTFIFDRPRVRYATTGLLSLALSGVGLACAPLAGLFSDVLQETPSPNPRMVLPQRARNSLRLILGFSGIAFLLCLYYIHAGKIGNTLSER